MRARPKITSPLYNELGDGEDGNGDEDDGDDDDDDNGADNDDELFDSSADANASVYSRRKKYTA